MKTHVRITANRNNVFSTKFCTPTPTPDNTLPEVERVQKRGVYKFRPEGGFKMYILLPSPLKMPSGQEGGRALYIFSLECLLGGMWPCARCCAIFLGHPHITDICWQQCSKIRHAVAPTCSISELSRDVHTHFVRGRILYTPPTPENTVLGVGGVQQGGGGAYKIPAARGLKICTPTLKNAF